MSQQSATLKQASRMRFRALRNQLTDQQQASAAVALVQQFLEMTGDNKPHNIAVFLANDGELSPHQIVEHCWQQGINTYLPVIDTTKAGYLLFYQYSADTPLTLNKYNIAEPDIKQAERIELGSLDWVLMPLVGFTENGERLGMGGGFYDRTFAPAQTNNQATKTQLIGVAHECQCSDTLPVDPWDVKMHAVLTPNRCIRL